MEQKLVEISDLVAPVEKFVNDQTAESTEISWVIKRKINLRKRLLKSLRRNMDEEKRCRLKNLTIEIRHHNTEEKRKKVRKHIILQNQMQSHFPYMNN